MSRLVLRFAVYAGVALALAGTGSVLVGRYLATGRAEQDAWSDARAIADELGRDDLARSALEQPAFGDVRAQLDELFGRVALGPDVVRVSLLDRNGRVTYSTEHGLIGSSSPEQTKLAEALAEKPVFGVAELDGAEVIESYVPVHWLLADPGWPAGVLAVHRDYAPVAEQIADQTKLQAGAVLLALLLLYLSLFPILDRVTRSLARSEARYRALTEQASDAILVCDARGLILEANAQAAALVGARVGSLVGRSFADLVDPDELARVPLHLADLHEGKVVLVERTLVRADGESVVAEVHAKKLEDGRILAGLRDLTSRREAEAAIRKAERAEATTRLAAGVAHDFSDLLTRIAGNSDLILARLPEGDPLVRQAELIQDATARGAELTGQLLAFGRRELPEPADVDVDPQEDAGGSSQGSETVLVVEDEHVVRALVREILEDEGYSVLEAADGREGLELATTRKVDLVLTDLVMPELGGEDMVTELERVRPNCRVVLMSAYDADVIGRPFLQKPFTHETLARTVRDTLDLVPV